MSAPSMRLRPSTHDTERMLILRVALSLGLALLLVVGAWSTSHGKADAHATLCLAPGITAASASEHHDSGISAVDAVSSDTGIAVVAALCCILLVLLVLRVGRDRGLVRVGTTVRASAPIRPGPRLHVPALTLTQLSLSRT